MARDERDSNGWSPPRPDAGAVLAVGRRQDDAVAHAAARTIRGVELSVSVTTRPQRPRRGRRPRLSFHRPRALRRMVEAGELLEWAEVFGNHYGTPRAPVDARARRRPRRAVRHRLAGHAAAAREGARRHGQRLRAAAVDSRARTPAAHARAGQQGRDPRRMAKAAGEISHWAEYDYVIINHELDARLRRSAGDPRGRAAQARAADRAFGFRARPAGGAVTAFDDQFS